ncbi:MAG: GNAT family N-acetyltransferase [Cyanobacteriota bacterium]
MEIKIVKIDKEELIEYSKIPMSFEINSFFDISLKKNGLEGITITEKIIDKPYLKDYDKYENPTLWVNDFDLTNWGIFIAKNEFSENIGGLAVAYKTQGNHMLEGRDDMTVLWDIRIHPNYRKNGIGSLLFKKAVDFSKEHNCKIIKIETQNNNVPACKFYAKQGCYLGGIHPNIYKEFPDEIQLLWYKEL